MFFEESDKGCAMFARRSLKSTKIYKLRHQIIVQLIIKFQGVCFALLGLGNIQTYALHFFWREVLDRS